MSKSTDVIAYSLSEAARELGVSVTQVRRLVEQEKLAETNLVGGHGRYVTAQSVTIYKTTRT